MTVAELADYWQQYGPVLRAQLLDGTYQPLPVKRVAIPKPSGGIRQLGIPVVVDRLIQQAILGVCRRTSDLECKVCDFAPNPRCNEAVGALQNRALRQTPRLQSATILKVSASGMTSILQAEIPSLAAWYLVRAGFTVTVTVPMPSSRLRRLLTLDNYPAPEYANS